MAQIELSIDAILQHQKQPAVWWLQQLQCTAGDTRAIERAIRKVALRVHPDHNDGSVKASEATRILMHSVKEVLTSPDGDHVHALFRSAKTYNRQSEQAQMDAATRGLDTNSVAWAVALAKVCSYNAGHYLSSAHANVLYKRGRANDAAEALAVDTADAAALKLFCERVTSARAEGAAWNAAALPYRAPEHALDLGRSATSYDIHVVRASPLFTDEWVRLEQEIAARNSLPASNEVSSKAAQGQHKRRAESASQAPRQIKQKTAAAAARSYDLIDLISSDTEDGTAKI